jgi:hypothetical protein
MVSKNPVPRRRDAEGQPGDEQGAYTRKQLLCMDARFSERIEKAFASGKESRQAAAGMMLPHNTSGHP